MYKLCWNLVFCVAHFQVFWHWLILCKLMFTPDLSDWMAYHAPLIPWFWAFSWLCASNVCTPFRRSYAFYAKIYIFHQTSITEDNAYMWLPLAFQVQYLDFYICLLHCVWFPGISCVHKSLYLIICHDNWFIASRLAWMPNVYCIYW